MNTLHRFWSAVLQELIHHLLPGCSDTHGKFGHVQVHLTDTELQTVFGVIDFSKLVFVHYYEKVFVNLIKFSKWLMCDVSVTDYCLLLFLNI